MQYFYVDRSDTSNPEIRPWVKEINGEAYDEPLTWTDAKREIDQHFAWYIEHWRSQRAYWREARKPTEVDRFYVDLSSDPPLPEIRPWDQDNDKQDNDKPVTWTEAKREIDQYIAWYIEQWLSQRAYWRAAKKPNNRPV